jgi:diacylglycerol kinase family enzyme
MCISSQMVSNEKLVWYLLFITMQFSDGCLDLVVLRDCSRWELFGLLFKLQDGSHIKSKSVEYLKVALCS